MKTKIARKTQTWMNRRKTHTIKTHQKEENATLKTTKQQQKTMTTKKTKENHQLYHNSKRHSPAKNKGNQEHPSIHH
ncbi:hypothetical protein [Lysinibacillus fusiformis]|uniref:hypothetical protein n=1 Tax=Lysinibacillus fusiformis TaxID=28031 RepID=UPI000B7FA2C1|nr:hypothetical protein [Lysinibacillus fusiformis]